MTNGKEGIGTTEDVQTYSPEETAAKLADKRAASRFGKAREIEARHSDVHYYDWMDFHNIRETPLE